jgi:hypothetical protein
MPSWLASILNDREEKPVASTTDLIDKTHPYKIYEPG